ncbi:2-hydroxyisoflavanone dehydratase-like [Impatiens glandulifera]|uniref:2-hydroxyisoflavanone dehydratase-like n=1 Tax=Impatiens glandulifera TaxID=253017 RepID=UPI001FB0C8A1|nr:2-hydroxyisoflavanone dehydratase-like [Impatiens glandulifera]XP_047306740.1 2-hydroxyisoflavanone dehydratase-like [Impatiens glandulifera]XP_047306741.1 2-hydroxyisoflavanone dehydratase-like [Impatiens glandulifera]
MATIKLNPTIIFGLFLIILSATISVAVAATQKDIFFKYYFIARIDGTVQKLLPPNPVPASLDAATNVQSTDVVINQQTKVSARLYRPMKADSKTRLPLLVYFHAGGFSISSAFDLSVHTYMNKLSSVGNIVILSVDHRLAPETPIASIYDDGFDAMKWVAGAQGGDLAWVKEVVDSDKIFVGGHDSGANIAHNVGLRVQKTKPAGVKVAGIIPIQGYFLTVDALPSLLSQTEDMRNNITQFWPFIVPGSSSSDPRVNPSLEPNLQALKPAKVLVCVSGKDGLKDASKAYYDALQKSGVNSEYYESVGKMHNFDYFAMDSAEATALQSKIISFMH